MNLPRGAKRRMGVPGVDLVPEVASGLGLGCHVRVTVAREDTSFEGGSLDGLGLGAGLRSIMLASLWTVGRDTWRISQPQLSTDDTNADGILTFRDAFQSCSPPCALRRDSDGACCADHHRT